MNILNKFFYVPFLAMIFAGPSQANIVLGGTRVVYYSDKKEVSFHLNNVGDNPSLVQSWVDDGDINQTSDKINVPFFLSPSIIRIEPGQKQILRIQFVGDKLPTDREKLYWLNVLEIPALMKKDGSILQMAVRSRVKLFYRPVSLPGDSFHVPGKLEWVVLNSAKGEILSCYNPTPYFVSLSAVTVTSRGRIYSVDPNRTIPPFSKIQYSFQNGSPPPFTLAEISVYAITDYGTDEVIKSNIKYREEKLVGKSLL